MYSASQPINKQTDLDPERDYLLIDNLIPGQGIPFDWSHYHYTSNFKWFLAGGLNADNVQNAIKQLKPDGVDVSSGVELKQYQKYPVLVKQFIEAVKENKS